MIEKLLLELSLYNPLSIDESNETEILDILYMNRAVQFDSHCIECGKDSTFRFYSRNQGNTSEYHQNRYLIDYSEIYSYPVPLQVAFKCQRDVNHIYSFNFKVSQKEVIKIGQYPSSASIDLAEIQKYRKALKGDYRDFSKSIGLFSHGVGAGSFVYLRRIFENLIEEKRQEALKEGTWDDSVYQQSRMDEKINLLRHLLPAILVETRSIYGILSKGIHELSEEECLTLFPNVKLAIELILDEKIYLLEQQSKIQSVKRFVSETVEALKS
ncbi:hypothetical protein [Sporosarcina cyprini]|uniref:hypothetical protein n=1 Tax=Sporosarcina cyprini TaxID=2910523 RepID=UPI001EDF110D|nr:hypothetical protein [Sporosarcina cyprini]MCG3089147.1 hypothetical protein [Sporosarcina cyprini]